MADPTAIDVYDELLDAFRGRACVGPLLRIRDISRHHPLFNGIMNDHVERIWHRRPTWVDTSHGRLAVQECLIDTTFAVHRAGEPFQRLTPGLGVYEPYEALHLDWYDDTRTLDPSYAETSCATVARWNNRERQARVLSFGCSTGEECATVGRYWPQAEVVGVDVNEDSLATARRRVAGARFHHAATLPDLGGFDLVLALSVLCRHRDTLDRDDIAAREELSAKAQRHVAAVTGVATETCPAR